MHRLEKDPHADIIQKLHKDFIRKTPLKTFEINMKNQLNFQAAQGDQLLGLKQHPPGVTVKQLVFIQNPSKSKAPKTQNRVDPLLRHPRKVSIGGPKNTLETEKRKQREGTDTQQVKPQIGRNKRKRTPNPHRRNQNHSPAPLIKKSQPIKDMKVRSPRAGMLRTPEKKSPVKEIKRKYRHVKDASLGPKRRKKSTSRPPERPSQRSRSRNTPNKKKKVAVYENKTRTFEVLKSMKDFKKEEGNLLQEKHFSFLGIAKNPESKGFKECVKGRFDIIYCG